MTRIHIPHTGASVAKRALTFNKIFRWEPADPHSAPPGSVAVIGTFSNWQAIPLVKDRNSSTWQLALNNLPGNRTHHYMLLVDGQPAKDSHADGMAIPENDQEKAWALITPRGPRLFMLFSQTK